MVPQTSSVPNKSSVWKAASANKPTMVINDPWTPTVIVIFKTRFQKLQEWILESVKAPILRCIDSIEYESKPLRRSRVKLWEVTQSMLLFVHHDIWWGDGTCFTPNPDWNDDRPPAENEEHEREHRVVLSPVRKRCHQHLADRGRMNGVLFAFWPFWQKTGDSVGFLNPFVHISEARQARMGPLRLKQELQEGVWNTSQGSLVNFEGIHG